MLRMKKVCLLLGLLFFNNSLQAPFSLIALAPFLLKAAGGKKLAVGVCGFVTSVALFVVRRSSGNQEPVVVQEELSAEEKKRREQDRLQGMSSRQIRAYLDDASDLEQHGFRQSTRRSKAYGRYRRFHDDPDTESPFHYLQLQFRGRKQLKIKQD